MERRSLILWFKDLSRQQSLRKKEIKGRVNRKDDHEGKGKVPTLIPSLESNDSSSSFTSWSLLLFYHLLLCLSLSASFSSWLRFRSTFFLFSLSATGSLKQQQKNRRTRNRANRPEKLSHVSYVCNTRPFIEWETVESHLMLVLKELKAQSVFDLGRMYKDRKKEMDNCNHWRRSIATDNCSLPETNEWQEHLSRLFILLRLQLHLQK